MTTLATRTDTALLAGKPASPSPAPAADPAARAHGWWPEFVLLAALWGASFLFTRIAAAEFGPLPTAGVRVAIAMVFLLPILLLRRQVGALRAHWRPVLAAGVLNSGLPFALFAFAVMVIPTGLTSILNATVPLFGALVAWAWLGDRLNASRALGLAIGFGGVAALAWGKTGGGAHPLAGWGVAACLAATLLYGFAASFARKHLTGVPPLATATGSQIGATLALAVPTLLLWPARTPGLNAWLALAVVGVFCTAIAYILYFRLIERAGPARALTVTFLVPVFAIGYGAAFLGERITLLMIGCGAVVMLGTTLSTGLVKLGRGGVGKG